MVNSVLKTNIRTINDPSISCNISKPKEIVFIDQSIDNYQILIDQVRSGIVVHLLNAQQDGILQLTEILRQYSNLDALHIVSHGNAGYITLGNSVLSTASLKKYQQALFTWEAALNDSADILIYGCEVGQGEVGLTFVQELAKITSCNIAASHNLTGFKDESADWNLTIETGHIQSAIAFNQEIITAYKGTLATQVENYNTDPSFAGGFATTFTLNGFTYTFTGDGESGDFAWQNNVGVGSTGGIKPDSGAGVTPTNTGTTERFTIAKSDTSDFVFNSIWLWSDTQSVTVTGKLNGSTVGAVTLGADNSQFQQADFAGGPTVVDVLEISSVDFDIGGPDAFDDFSYDLVVNASPAISIDNATLTYTEGNAATQIDSAATVSDADGDAEWNGGTLVAQITGNAESGDRISIVDSDGDGTAITISGTNIFANGTDIGDLSASGGIVTGGTALTITFDSDATNANVQEVLQSLRYDSTTNDPGTSNRTITLTATDKNAGSNADTRTVSVTAVNDEPTLTATGSNPTFTEDGAAASLFSGASVSTIESGQTISALTFTINNLSDGSSERLNIDGTTVVLTHGTSGTTATNSLNYSVSVVGSTGTISLTGGTLSTAATQTLINNISYQNNSNTPNTSNRVVTVTSIQDSGGTANGGDNTAALAIASTVTVTSVNDEPTLTATGSNPTFTEGGAAAGLFSGASASTIESGQTLTALTLTVTNVNDGSNEILNTDGTAIVLTNGTSGTTASNSLSYSVSVSGTTATVSLSGGTLSTAAAQTLIDNISYQNNSNTPNTSNRVVTITSLQDSGGTANGGDDTAALAIASTVTVVGVNDEPTLTATGSNPTFTEGGAAASLFSSANISTVEAGQNITGLSFTITNVTDGSNERLNVDGTTVVLTHGTSGITAGNSLNYSVFVIGTTATVTMIGGNLSTAAAQTLVDNMSYQNNSNTPNTSNRVVTLTSIQDSGGTANGGDNNGSFAVASTVTVVQNNDEPTLTATGSNPTFTEGGAAAGLFSGSSVSTIESGQTLSALTLTVTNVNDGSNEILNTDGTAIVLTNGTSGTTASNSLSYSVSVAGTTATVSLSGGTLSTAAAQTLIDNISYQNNSNTPNTSNRVVTITSLQDSGGTANGGDDTVALAIASTVTVVGVNDEPTLTATGSNPTFTEGGAAASLFSSANIGTVEAGQNITGLSFTITNVTDGSNERLNVDGTTVVLTHGTNGSTAGNSLNYSVFVIGTTATVTMTGGNLSTAAAQTLVDNMSYQNNSNSPSTSNRVVTLATIQDSGGTANGGDNNGSFAVASTVTVVQNNDEPTLTATGSNPTFTEGGAAAGLFSGSSVSTIESGQTLSALTLTVTNVNDGSNELLNTDGTAIVLTHGTSGTTASNSLSYSVSVSGTTATVSLSGGTLSTAATQTLINGISYQNNSNTPNTSNRVVTITSLQDSGGTANGGDDTAALAIASTVTVVESPKITSATYDAVTGVLVVTGTNIQANGGGADIDVSTLTFTGEGGATYTLTDSSDVERDSTTQFTVTLSATDKAAINQIINNNGVSSTSGTTYNLAAADDWNTNLTVGDTSDLTGNGIIVSNVAIPTITSATYDASSGQLVIAGTNFVNKSGATNDIDASLFSFTGEGGSTYTLTDTSDVEITSSTAATITLSATDQININGLLNKNGTTAADGATNYNVAAADNWLTGAPTVTDIADFINVITVSNVQTPTITSAAYDALTHTLFIEGTNLFKNTGANNDIDVSRLTMVGTTSHTLATTSDVEITSATSFTINVTGSDMTQLYSVFDQLGTTSSNATTYNIQAADGWLTAADPIVDISDNNAEGGVTVTINPTISSSIYNAVTGVLVVTGTDIQANGGGADIDVSMLTFTGEGGATYTLTDSSDVERDSIVQFTVTLSATDKAAVNLLLNNTGTSSTGGTTYNLAAADDWNTSITVGDSSDLTGNVITVTNVPAPTITSATYHAATGALTVTGTGFVSLGGAVNDIIANKFTVTGEGAESYTLTDTANVEITSGTAFTLTLSATDKAAVNQIINKDGTTSTGGTTYNLAAAEDWAAGAEAAVNVVDATGNGITASNVATPTITSATYNTGTGVLVVTGTGLLKLVGANNDIDASLLTFTGLGGGTYTLSDTADVDITSSTAFTLTLSATDKAAVNALLDANGTAAGDTTTYNLAAAEDWAAGANAAVSVADLAGNGVTVTVASPPSGGGGATTPDPTETPTVTTEIIDGITVSEQTETNGSTTLTVPIVDSTRIDDPDTLSETHADIPILANDAGDPVLTVSLPTGVGLTVNGQSQPLNTQDAINDLIQRIEQETTNDNDALQEMTVHGQEFIASLDTGDTVTVQTISLTVSDDYVPGTPIIINGSDFPGDGKTALVIDASSLPPGTVIQLNNVAFAAIFGKVDVTGGAGENFVAGDDQAQFVVLGASDDILFGGGGNDTIGSLGGNDQTHGDAGDDIVYGGAGHDILTGGAGNDALNGGLGFDIAVQAGQSSDYKIQINGNHVTLTHNDGVVDVLTDIELIQFETGPNLAVAHSDNEAVAHHLAKTWLGRDLTTAEIDAMQNWSGTDVSRIVDDFLGLPEAAGLQQKTTDELLAGLNNNPDIVRLDSVRGLTGGNSNDQGYLPLGLALNVDGGGGHDVLKMHGGRENVHLEQINDSVEITRLEDGAMLSLKNAEMIAFDSGENVLLAHNQVEGILGRLFQTFFDRDATIDEWQLGRKALADHINPEIILGWFQSNSGLNGMNDTDYIQALYSQTLGRPATETELNQQQLRLENGEISREWLAVDIANSDEALSIVGSVILLEDSL